MRAQALYKPVLYIPGALRPRSIDVVAHAFTLGVIPSCSGLLYALEVFEFDLNFRDS
jgi:hypothetical protein